MKIFLVFIFAGIISFPLLTASSVFAIDAPNLISPEQNATRSPGDVTFEWSSVPTGDWKSYTSYNLYITSLDSQRTEIKESTNDTKKTVQFTAPGSWYWLVEACENIGLGPLSYQTGCIGSQPLRSLTISSPIAQPTSIGPGITQTEEDAGAMVEVVKVTNPTLTWQWNGDTTILKNFNIYINGNLESGVGKNDPKLIKNGNQYSYAIDPGILKQGEPYSWYVVALSITNDRSQPSETRLFKVEAITSALQPPTLDSSRNEPISPTYTPVLYWVLQSGINCYEAEVKVKDGQMIWSDKTNKSSIMVPTTAKLENGKTYNWRARASKQDCASAADYSDWSGLGEFKIQLPGAPAGVPPAAPPPSSQAPSPAGGQAQATGLVKCGPGITEPAERIDPKLGYVPCGFCDIFLLANNVLKYAFTLALIIGALLIIIGGVLFFLAGAQPNIINQAKGIFFSVVIGLLLIFGAWVIVNTVFEKSSIVKKEIGGRPWEWYNITCQTK